MNWNDSTENVDWCAQGHMTRVPLCVDMTTIEPVPRVSDAIQTCVVCAVGDGILVSMPCGCSGSIGRVHVPCLLRMAQSRSDGVCPTCRRPFVPSTSTVLSDTSVQVDDASPSEPPAWWRPLVIRFNTPDRRSLHLVCGITGFITGVVFCVIIILIARL